MVATSIRSQNLKLSNCEISARCRLSTFSHRVKGKNNGIRTRAFTHQISVLLYIRTQRITKIRHSDIYIIIPCDFCYDVKFLKSCMPRKPVCNVKTFFLCEHLLCNLRQLTGVCHMDAQHVICTDIFIKEIIKLLPTNLAHSICSAQRSNTMPSHLICTSCNEHSNAVK